jgi:hypothetical protein
MSPHTGELAAIKNEQELDSPAGRSLDTLSRRTWEYVPLGDSRQVAAFCVTLKKGDHSMASATKCPVCRWEIKDDGKQVKVNGRIVLVCCDDCAKKVKADPAKYIVAK